MEKTFHDIPTTYETKTSTIPKAKSREAPMKVFLQDDLAAISEVTELLNKVSEGITLVAGCRTEIEDKGQQRTWIMLCFSVFKTDGMPLNKAQEIKGSTHKSSVLRSSGTSKQHCQKVHVNENHELNHT